MITLARIASRGAVVLALVLSGTASESLADPSSPAVEQRREPPSVASADSEYNRGIRARVAKDWKALRAYDEALRLKPNFPEALEYLGEAYVKMGRLEDARRVLERLRPLDSARAQELAEVIQHGK